MSKIGDQTFSIGRVAELSHLSTHTIRAWEKRYGVVTPSRTQGGSRRYSEQDLRRLQHLRAAVESGHRIGDVAQFDESRLVQITQAAQPRKRAALVHAPAWGSMPIPDDAIQEVIGHALALDAASVERSLEVQYGLLGTRRFRGEFCPQVLFRVGELWEKGELGMAVEHLLSAVVKHFLMRVFSEYRPSHGAPKILFTTPTGEQHDLGMLMAAGAAVEAGAEVINLGSDLPADAVIDVATQIHPMALALSAVQLSKGAQRTYLKRLRTALPQEVEIWLGGANASSDISGCYVIDFDEMVRRISIRSGALCS